MSATIHDKPLYSAAAMPRGIVPVIDTPFDDQGRIDLESLARLIDDAIAGGVHGLIGPVVASEVHALTNDEREILVRSCARAIHRRVPYIVGASSVKPEDSRRSPKRSERTRTSSLSPIRFMETPRRWWISSAPSPAASRRR